MRAPASSNRRRALAGLSLLAPGVFLRPALASPSVQRSSRMLMGTRVDIVLDGGDPDAARAAMQAAFAEMARLERMMSRYHPASTVSALQRSAGQGAVDVAPEMMAVLKKAAQVSALSHGAFDVTVGAYAGWEFSPDRTHIPSDAQLRRERALIGHRDVALDEPQGQARLTRPGMRLDLGGIAKLAILDAGMQVLRAHNQQHAMINGGGDVLVGGQLQGHDWRIGVRDPRAPQRLIGTVSLSDGVVASSGDYERCFVRDGKRYHQVLDPRTGYPSTGVRGAVMVSRGIDAVNGLGAALMVAGAPAGGRLLASLSGVDGLIVDSQSRVSMSGAMAERLRG